MNYWTTYLKHFPSFYFEFSFKVNNENFKDRILKFDERVLKNGLKYKIFKYDELQNIESIDCYLESRKEKFWLDSNQNNLLKLLDLKQWKEYTGQGIRSINLPFIESNKMVNKNFNYKDTIHEVLYSEVSFDLFENDLEEEYWEDKELYFSISSNSNIWWEEFNVTIIDGEKWVDRSFYNPPINNRVFSYRVTPRLNSFIRELKKIIIELGGTIKLEEHNTSHVTNDGILLDGKIIYQEDIDEGRILLPEIQSLPS